MAIVFTPVAAYAQPSVPGSRRNWKGTVTLDGASYVNGTGWTIAAAKFGLAIVDFANISMATVFTHVPVVTAIGANLVIAIVVSATDAELATNAGNGLIFNFDVTGA